MDSIIVAVFFLFLVLCAVWWVWDDRLRKVPLEEFGIETVQRVLRFETSEYREKVWTRGWMTRKEWRDLLTRQNEKISAELKRRGVE